MVKENRYIPNFVLNAPVRNISRFPLKIVSGYLQDGFTVADVGSGPGYYSLRLAKLRRSINVIAVEPNPSAVKYLEGLILRKGINNIKVVKEPADSISSIEDGSVDFVFSHLMLCCMSNHYGAMDETMRILKSGGNAFISVNRSSSAGDSRDLTPDEWESIKKRFNVVADGKSLISRWVIIHKDSDDDSQHQ